MSVPDASDRTVVEGSYGVVEFAVDSDAYEWHLGLDMQVAVYFGRLFERLAETGVIRDELKFKHLDGPVWEFKRRSGERLLCYRDGRRWLLTNAFKKSGRSNIKGDIQRAKTIGERHLAWEESQKKKIQG